MVLQVTGVQFVNNGLGNTLSGLTQYNTQLLKTTQTILNSTRTWNNAYNNVANNSTKSFSLIGSITNNFAGNFNRSMSNSVIGMGLFSRGIKNLILAVTGLMLLRSVIRSVIDTLSNLWATMIEGASNTQLLEIRFENLTAISIQVKQGIENYADALKMAQDPAKDLLEWINQYAVKTMFSRDEIANVLALGMAFDMTAGQSQTLTVAMANWASGMGLEGDALQRMTVNFGQMMRMGKVTQRELRDLAIGGLFPVNEALERIGKKAGLAGDALSDFMSNTATSGLPVNALLTEFVAIANERFPNAAEKMAQTWKGVTQNIKDFVTTILGAALLGPTMDKIVTSLSSLLDKALTPAVRGAANEIGERLATNLEKLVGGAENVIGALGNLAKAFGITIPSIQKVIAYIEIFVEYITMGMNEAAKAVNNWVNTSGSTFARGASEFLTWGLEMVTQFAIGIIQGATTALAAAMNVISSILSFFLGPGSPPRVAPDIDIWGESAMNEFLKGMTNADFDILKDLQSPIQSALNVMANLGLIAKDSVGTIFYDISKQIIAAMHELETTGQVSEAVFESIRAAGGALGDELEELARRQFALLAATQALAKAQEELNTAQTADTSAKKNVDDLINQYRELVKSGAGKDVLKAKRAEIKAAMDARQQTKADVLLAEEKVKSAEDVLDPLREQVKLQEQLVQQMIALAQAQVEAQKAASGGAGEGGSGVFGSMGDALKDFEAEMKNARVQMAIAQIEMRSKIETLRLDIIKELGTIFGPISEQWKTEISPAIDRVAKAFETLTGYLPKGDIFGSLTGEGAGKLGQVAGSILAISLGFSSISAVLGIITKPLAGIVGLFGTMGGVKVAGKVLPFLGKVGLGLGVVGVAAGALYLAWDNDFLGMRTSITKWYETNKTKIDEIVGMFQEGKIKEAIGELGKIIDDWFNSVDWKKTGETFWTNLKTGVGNVTDNITTWLKETDWMLIGAKIGYWLGDALSTGIKGIFKFGAWILTALSEVKWSDVADDLWKWFVDAIVFRIDFFVAGWETVFGLVSGFFAGFDFGGVVTAMWTAFVAGMKLRWDLFKEGWKTAFDFINGLLMEGGELLVKVVQFGSRIMEIIGNFVKEAAIKLGKAIIDGIKNGLGLGGSEDRPVTKEEWEKYVPGIPWPGDGYAKGGLVQNEGLYHLAEQGPEMVIPAGITSQFLRGVQSLNRMRSANPVSARPAYISSSNNTNNRNFNLSVSIVKSTGNVISDFGVMQTLAG